MELKADGNLSYVESLSNKKLATQKEKRVASPIISSIAVLPLENLSGDPRLASFIDSMTDALNTELSEIEGLTVIAPSSAIDAERPNHP